MKRVINSNKLIKIIWIGIGVFILLLIIYIMTIHRILYPYFSSRYDKTVIEHILSNKSQFSKRSSDTIYVTDRDFYECGYDSRNFIDKKYTRLYIETTLKELGYTSIIFIADQGMKRNDGLEIEWENPIIDSSYAAYGLHIWTETNGFLPLYSIKINETYYNDKILTSKKTLLKYSLWNLIN